MLGPAETTGPAATLLRSAGRPVPGSVVTIQDANGTSCRPARTGEVCARGGNFMREYWSRPEETESAFAGGWYHTGDAGRLDEAGYLYLVDRVKDMIVTGGENVYSAEVENAVSSHPAVAEVAVIGIPSEQWGESGARHRRAEAWDDGHRRRAAGMAQGTHRRLQGPEVDRVPRRAPSAVGGDEGPQAGAARPVLEGPRPVGVNRRLRTVLSWMWSPESQFRNRKQTGLVLVMKLVACEPKS